MSSCKWGIIAQTLSCWLIDCQECIQAMDTHQTDEVVHACVYDVCLTRHNVTNSLCENINAFVERCGKEFNVEIRNWRDPLLCRRLLGFRALALSLFLSFSRLSRSARQIYIAQLISGIHLVLLRMKMWLNSVWRAFVAVNRPKLKLYTFVGYVVKLILSWWGVWLETVGNLYSGTHLLWAVFLQISLAA